MMHYRPLPIKHLRDVSPLSPAGFTPLLATWLYNINVFTDTLAGTVTTLYSCQGHRAKNQTVRNILYKQIYFRLKPKPVWTNRIRPILLIGLTFLWVHHWDITHFCSFSRWLDECNVSSRFQWVQHVREPWLWTFILDCWTTNRSKSSFAVRMESDHNKYIQRYCVSNDLYILACRPA